jgi:hypothetical protein
MVLGLLNAVNVVVDTSLTSDWSFLHKKNLVDFFSCNAVAVHDCCNLLENSWSSGVGQRLTFVAWHAFIAVPSKKIFLFWRGSQACFCAARMSQRAK